MKFRTLLAAIVATSTACSNAAVKATGVASSPPDSMPADILASYDSIFGGPDDVLWIQFEPGTSVREKAAAIAAIDARVVGGDPWEGRERDGWYIVRFESKGVESDLMPKLTVLDANPVVYLVTPMTRLTTM